MRKKWIAAGIGMIMAVSLTGCSGKLSNDYAEWAVSGKERQERIGEKEMRKKWIAAGIGMIMAVSLTGCSGKLSNDYVTKLSNDYVTINQYKGLEVSKVEKTEVTDEMVENTINSYLTADQTKTEITDRAAELGDTVDIDYTGTMDGVAFDGGSATGAMLELGSGSFIGATDSYKGFEEQIVGHNSGETFTITVQFPSDYPKADFSDKVADFEIKLNKIYEVKTPELTDEWVQTMSEESKTVEEFKKEIREKMEKNVEEFKKEIREKMEKNIQASADGQLQQAVMEAFLEQTEVKKLPQDQVDEQYKSIEGTYQKMAEAYGVEFAEFLSGYMNMTEEQFKEQAQEVAETAVKRDLACKLLAEKKNLEPSDKEYEEMAETYAKQSNYEDVESFKKEVGEDVVKSAVLQQKVVEYLADNCVQVEPSDSEK